MKPMHSAATPPLASSPRATGTAATAPRWRFPLALALLLALMVALAPPAYRGDGVEYTVGTVALADHGSPDIRLQDIARARVLLGAEYRDPLDLLERGMRAGEQDVYAAFTRGRHGDVYMIHFFGYPLLAAAPFKVFELVGVAPFKAFLAVNLGAVFLLGLALRHFFGNGSGAERRAWAALGLFMLCGGALYWRWSSPECVSAALLLAGLLLFASGAPGRGALLAGVASWQNPTILFFFGFAPLLLLCLDWRAGLGLAANLRALATRRNLAGLALGMAVFAVPPLFNLLEYGVPNIIAKKFSDPSLVGAERLFSFFFDLNQGMSIGLPGLLAALLLWRRAMDARLRRMGVAALLFVLALALPALAVLNWNSDAAGMMRYAFWASMPLLFVLLAMLRERAWPAPLVIGVGLAQALAMAHAASYPYVAFSPLARQVLAHAPALYHPEPEIFAERAGHHDNYIEPGKVYSYRIDGVPVKTLFNLANPQRDAALCGSGATIAPDNASVDSTRGWRYIDGPVRCVAGALAQRSFRFDELRDRAQVLLETGWSTPEANGPGWNGVWSDGAHSRLVLQLGALRPREILIDGAYFEDRGRTRVRVNGADLGWRRLDRDGALALTPAAAGHGRLVIELEHEAPRSPGAADPRRLAFFLREISVRALPASQP